MITEANVWSKWTDREHGSQKAQATSQNHCLDFMDMPASHIIVTKYH